MARITIDLSKEDVAKAIKHYYKLPPQTTVLISAVEKYDIQSDEPYYDVQITASYSQDLEDVRG